MQDQYVGDIGDFGKYALLKFLGTRDVLLGIVWYLTSAKGGSTDGGFIQYLSSPDEANGLGNCNEELFDTLREIVQGKDRRVARVRECWVLPGRTQFYEERLDFAGVPPQKRPEVRKSWCDKALKQVEEADLVFLDPDNGPSLNGKMKYRKTGPKYVFLDEIRQFLSRRQSLMCTVTRTAERAALLNRFDKVSSCSPKRARSIKHGRSLSIASPCESISSFLGPDRWRNCWPGGPQILLRDVSVLAGIFDLWDFHSAWMACTVL